MRISDWSSDVCSSDLPANTKRDSAKWGPQKSTLIDDVSPNCQIAIDGQWRCRSGSLETVEAYRAAVHQGDIVGCVVREFIGKLTGVDPGLCSGNRVNLRGCERDVAQCVHITAGQANIALADDVDRAWRGRSEEHTSELQS